MNGGAQRSDPANKNARTWLDRGTRTLAGTGNRAHNRQNAGRSCVTGGHADLHSHPLPRIGDFGARHGELRRSWRWLAPPAGRPPVAHGAGIVTV